MRSFIRFAAIAAAAAPLMAAAVPITGQGQPTDNINLTGGTVIDFESGGASSSPSLTIGNVTFTGNANIEIANDFAGQFNTRGVFHITNFGRLPSSFTFTFGAPVNAFGFLFGASDEIWDLTARDSGNNVLETLAVNPVLSSNAGDYFGIAASGIASATLVLRQGLDYVFIDNFTYTAGSTAVPEPATLALVGLALAGLGLRGKARKA